MSIDIDIYSSLDACKAVCNVEVQATVLYSPREGFDPDKIEALERDLGTFIKQRLNAALKKGGAA